MRSKARHTTSAAAILLHCVFPGLALAQAWLPEKGTLGINLQHVDVLNKKHYTPTGDAVDVGHTRSFSDSLTLTYSLSNKLLLLAAVPYVRGKYYGARPHVGTDIDDGNVRGTITDLRVALHYQLLDGPVAFAPYLTVVVPLKDYPTLGHAAPGRRLDEQWLGFFAAASLDRWLPRTYVQMRYSYAFVQRLQNIAHDRSNADLELGYFFNPRWSARALASWQQTHGGIDVPVPPTNPYYLNHDRLAAERFVQLGAGVAWQINDGTSVAAIYKSSVSGANGHKVDDSVSVGISYSFRANNRRLSDSAASHRALPDYR